MCKPLTRFKQNDYCRVLDNHNGNQLSYAQCVKILMDHGARYSQATAGAYIYLHHGQNLVVYEKGSQDYYDQILDKFQGTTKSNIECIRHLENLGYSQGQAKSAAYKYRKSKGLVR